MLEVYEFKALKQLKFSGILGYLFNGNTDGDKLLMMFSLTQLCAMYYISTISIPILTNCNFLVTFTETFSLQK